MVLLGPCAGSPTRKRRDTSPTPPHPPSPPPHPSLTPPHPRRRRALTQPGLKLERRPSWSEQSWTLSGGRSAPSCSPPVGLQRDGGSCQSQKGEGRGAVPRHAQTQIMCETRTFGQSATFILKPGFVCCGQEVVREAGPCSYWRKLLRRSDEGDQSD
ncbi:uncharacterized protein V6R79_024776 [Siganus canaliculatus]